MTGYFLVDWLQLALSLFCCILLLWLGLTVLLNSERRTGSVLLVSGTAFLGSTFFAAHTALLQIAPRVAANSLDFWWRMGWLVLAALPYGWYVIVLWFGGYGETHSPLRLLHRLPLIVLGAVMSGLLLALLFLAPLPSFAQMIQLQPNGASFLGLPWFLLLYPLYTLACMVLALAALRAAAPAAGVEVNLARRRARPWLLATTALLAAVSLLVAAAIGWFQTLPRDGTVGASALLAGAAWWDLAVSALLAAAVILIGQALVHYEIFSGRTLPRRELRRHWNYALVLAGGYGVVVGGSLAYGLRPVYNLLLAALLMAGLFALTGWRTFNRQQDFVRRLHPFVASAHLYTQLTGQATDSGTQASPPARFAAQEQTGTPPTREVGAIQAGDAFTALCRDILNTNYAVLLAAGPLAMLLPQPLAYPPGAQGPPTSARGEWLEAVLRQAKDAAVICLPLRLPAAPQAAWIIPLRSGDQFLGVLLLGERSDSGLYTQEEIEVAKATGERLLDLRAGAELARRLLQAQRTRLVESTVLDRQARRVLHDDVLPELHTALLLLNQGSAGAVDAPADVAEASALLMSAHRRIAELLRALPVRPATQPGGGLLPALHHLLENDFAGQFDRVEWKVAAEAEALTADLPAVTAEVLFYALREAIRNAARYGRGGDEARPLTLRIGVHAADGLQLVIADDGAGIALEDESHSPSGSGQGLALHTAMLAVVGATMTVNTSPGVGTQVLIALPKI